MPAVWHNGVLTRLPVLPQFDAGFATAINDSGLVSGYCRSGDAKQYQACLWRNAAILLINMAGWSNTRALALNRRGQVLVQASNDETKPPAYFLWTNNQMNPLPIVPLLNTEIPTALNANGQVLISGPKAAIWKSGRVTPLVSLPSSLESDGAALNNQGQAAGYDRKLTTTTSDIFRACLWQDGKVIALGAIPGNVISKALGINEQGQAVGDCGLISGDGPSAGRTYATLWSGGRIFDLKQCITDANWSSLIKASGINNRGQIIGTGELMIHGMFKRMGFLLTPVVGNRYKDLINQKKMD